MEAKKELIVPAIENGTVIDHIPTDVVYQVIRILGLDKYNDEVLIGNYLHSKKFGRKGIVKIKNKFFDKNEINKIALVAPLASIITIRNYEIVEKIKAEIPDRIDHIIKCMNPKCITNFEQIDTKFYVVDKENLKLRCHYCEKFTTKETMKFQEI
ncbi:MAG: aspartate carbamoyltransferase regulatory subunit [Bacteroidales bacterium]|nr:aspartate carbamoyltransferase regulatory subunit [Bacteroidales bacterium]MBP5189755.1 aspartate carbamoyltransferase regulatory subunit [Bacteroidales bacterium]